MTTQRGIKWYEHQKHFDAESRKASEKLLGAERDVFVDAMSLVAECLDLAREHGPPQDLASKRKISLATHCFNLLWSAWDAVLAGRYDAAAGSWRSINETPDLLLALFADPTFAVRMQGRKKDVDSARKIVRDNLVKSGLQGAKELSAARQVAAKLLQPYSHVSF